LWQKRASGGSSAPQVQYSGTQPVSRISSGRIKPRGVARCVTVSFRRVRLAGLRKWSAAILLFCLAAGGLPAAVQDYEGKPIGLIVFEPKQQPLAAEELSTLLPLKKNDTLRLVSVREAINRLYATGRYADIAVDATLESGQVTLRFLTKGNWFVGNVSVNNIPAPPSLGQLTNAAGLVLGSPFSKQDLAQAVEGMRQTLAANGYFQPKIEERLSYQERTQQVDVRFEVTPGARARFGPPVITGKPERPASAIIKETGWKGRRGWRPLTESRVQHGLERILESYRRRNFLMARANLLSIDPATGVPALEVNAGPQVLVEATGAKVSRGRLRRLLPVFEERSVDRDLLLEIGRASCRERV
jgi:outer membrane protein insertion porin family